MKVIINWAFFYWRATLSIFFLLGIWGVFSYIHISREEFPTVNQPGVNIVELLNGLSPQDAEVLLARPIENHLRDIDGITEVNSLSFRGGVLVQATFSTDIKVVEAVQQVQKNVDLARADLPSDASNPIITQSSTSDIPILSLIIHGRAPFRIMVEKAEELKQVLETLPNVLSVGIYGNSSPRVNLIMDPITMENYHISPLLLINSIRKNNKFIPAGEQSSKVGAFFLKVPSLLQTIGNIMNVPLLEYEGKVVRVKDIADVHSTFNDRQTYVEYNHDNAILLFVSKRAGSNVIDTIKAIKKATQHTTRKWASDIYVDYSQDSSERVNKTLFNMQNNLVLSVLIVMILVIAFLGIKNGILIGISIPGSFFSALLVLYLLNITLNIVVLFSFILAGGMLVDTTIVVIEYAEKQKEQGLTKLNAYRQAAIRMAWPVITSTLTTLAAFVPLMFWPGVVGQFMMYLPITVSTLLIASTVMALIFIPVLGGYLQSVARFLINVITFIVFFYGTYLIVPMFFPNKITIIYILIGVIVGLIALLISRALTQRMTLKSDDKPRTLSKTQGRRAFLKKRTLSNKVSSHNIEVNILPRDLRQVRGLIGLYVRLLNVVLKVPRLFVVLIVLLMIGSWVWYISEDNGVKFFPDVDPTFMQVNVLARGNLSAYQKDNITKKVTNAMYAMNQEHKDFLSVISTGGNLLTYGTSFPPDIVGYIVANLNDWDTIRPLHRIQADLNRRLKNIPGIKSIVLIPQLVPRSSDTDVEVQIKGQNRAEINAVLNKIRAHLQLMPELIDMYDSQGIPGVEWELTINRIKAAKANVSIIEIGAVLQMATIGLQLDKYMPVNSIYNEQTKIYARFPQRYRTITELENLHLVTASGNIPLSNFVVIQPDKRTNVLYRDNNQEEGFIKANVKKNYNIRRTSEKINNWIISQNFNSNLTISMEGVSKDISKAFKFLIVAFIMTILLMSAILLIQFNNFFQMMLVLSAVVLSTTGVAIYMAILHTPFGVVMQGIAAISLAGIVVNNNIVLIDTYNALRFNTKSDVLHIIITSCGQRLRPVVLTAGTTMLGLLPVALGLNIDFFKRTVSVHAPSVEFWVSLSSTIVAGMLFATILTLFVTPSILLWRANSMEKHSNTMQQNKKSVKRKSPRIKRNKYRRR